MTGLQRPAPLILPSADNRLGWAARFPRGCTPGWYVLPCQGKYKVTLQWARSADFVLASPAGERAGVLLRGAERNGVSTTGWLSSLYLLASSLEASTDRDCHFNHQGQYCRSSDADPYRLIEREYQAIRRYDENQQAEDSFLPNVSVIHHRFIICPKRIEIMCREAVT
jgi:hypothetical protein